MNAAAAFGVMHGIELDLEKALPRGMRVVCMGSACDLPIGGETQARASLIQKLTFM
jgi:hypothetical protein